MPRKNNIIPHLILRENFRDRQSILNNDCEITGTPTINNGVVLTNPTTNYVSIRDIARYNPNFSLHIRALLNSNDGGRLIGSSDGGLNAMRSYLDAGNNRHYLYLKIGASVQFAPYQDLDPFIGSGDQFTLSWVFTYDGTNTVIKSYLNGVLVGTSGNFAGQATKVGKITMGYWNNTNTGADGVIYEFQIFDKALDTKDILALHDGTLSQDISPNKASFILPGDYEYTNTAGNKATPYISKSATKEAIIGDGSTTTTFPVLGSDRLWTFDGGDYIDIGDDDNFSFGLSNPVTIGGLCSINDITATVGLLAKGTSSVRTGEWCIYLSGSLIRFALIDNANAAFNQIRTSNISSYIRNKRLFSIIVTYDGSGTFDTTTGKIYIDGVNRANSALISGAFTTIQNTAIKVTLGGFSDPITFMTGKLGLFFQAPYEFSPLQVEMAHNQLTRWSTI